MSALDTVRRVTVYADSALEHFLIEQFLKLGAKGYTVLDCRGKGKHEIVDDPFQGATRVRIELIVSPEVGEKLIGYLAHSEFRLRAVLACIETVQVAQGELS